MQKKKEKLVERIVLTSSVISSAVEDLQRIALNIWSMADDVTYYKSARERVKRAIEIVDKDLLGKTKS